MVGRGLVSIVVRETEERAYLTTIEAQNDEEYRSQMLDEALTAVRRVETPTPTTFGTGSHFCGYR